MSISQWVGLHRVRGGGRGLVAPLTNEPVGMTMLLTHDGSAIQPNSSWSSFAGQVSVESDAERGAVLQLAYSPVTVPGSSAASLYAQDNPAVKSYLPTKLYVSAWMKLSPNYKGNNGAGGSKNFFLEFQQQQQYNTYLTTLGNDPADVDSRIRHGIQPYLISDHDGLSVGNVNPAYYIPTTDDPNDPGDLFPRNSWRFIEWLWTANSAPGVADGTIKSWVGGLLVEPTVINDLYINGMHGTGLKFVYNGVPRWTGLNMDNTWGGGGTPILVDNWVRYKDFYISGAYARAGERPSYWTITVDTGGTSTPAAGTSVPIKAQLFDENDNAVDVYNPMPDFSVVGPGTFRARAGGVPADAEHGIQLGWIDVDSGATSSQDIAITCSDDAKTNNGTVTDHHRASNTLHLTVA